LTAVLLVSLVLALVATGWSVILLARSGEVRFGLLTALFALVALGQAVALPSHWGHALGVDLPTTAAVAGLLACALGLLVLGAVADIGAERDRMEALHWDSMEAIRSLSELTVETKCDFDGKLRGLLEIGCGYLGLEIGFVSRVRDGHSEIVAIRGNDRCGIEPGAAFALGETFCRNVITSDRPIAIPRIQDSSWSEDPARSALGFESYIGTAIPIRGEVYGVLCFASQECRTERFTATEKDLLDLMARWTASEIERRDRPQARPEPALVAPASTAEAPEPRPGRRPVSVRGLDANRVLRRLEGRLQRLAGAHVELEVDLAEDLEVARAPGVPLEQVVRSLVANALEAMPGGGRLTLRTANLEIGAGEPGVLPSIAPDRYVTLSVSDTGNGIDADSLSRVFEPSAEGAPRNAADAPLSMPTVYRVLQRAGGDLSVEVEPGRRTTFTVFLPRAGETRRRPRAAADAAAVAVPADAAPLRA
jgi:CRISPR-associated Cas5-like protein